MIVNTQMKLVVKQNPFNSFIRSNVDYLRTVVQAQLFLSERHPTQYAQLPFTHHLL